MGAVYLLSVSVGMVMAHAGSPLALSRRDAIVATAHRSDPSAIAFDKGRRLEAALLDFGGNLVRGAVPQTITGLTVVSPFGFAAYQGWVGGIVSVTRDHRSRLASWRPALSYLLTLVLQLIPYSIAGGVGVRLGLSYFRAFEEFRGEHRWLGYPYGALKDALRAYAVVTPLFLIASLWEFLNPWV